MIMISGLEVKNDMMFFGDFLSGNVMSVPCTPTDIDNINKIELSNGWYDDLRVTHNVEEKLETEINQDWDWDTILHAKFDNSTGGGNVLWNFDTVSHLLIKRKKVDEFKWITLEVHKIEAVEDFNIRNIDKTAAPNFEYQYAAVPIKNGVEGFYSICNVDVKSNCLVIIDKDEIWTTLLTDNNLDNTSVVPSSVVETMYDKYPTVVRNSNANYEQITVNASFFPTDGTNEENGCTLDMDDDKKLVEYNRRVKDFLTNGKAKVLKSSDGRCWLIDVNQPPSDTATDHYKNRKLSFGVVEIGNIENEEDLYTYGFTDVASQWWNR